MSVPFGPDEGVYGRDPFYEGEVPEPTPDGEQDEAPQ